MNRTEPKPRRRSKKTEALEIRVSPEEKSAFLEACRRTGRTASAVLRDAMRAYASFGPMARLPGSPIVILSAFAGAAGGAYLLLQLTSASAGASAERLYGMSEFQSYDRNSDRMLDREEFPAAYGSARAILTDDLHGVGASAAAGRWGRLAGSLFIPADLDIHRFSEQPGTISSACWQSVEQVHNAVLATHFAHWDRDGDDIVTAVEYSDVKLAGHRLVFDFMDRNADGVVRVSDFDLPQRSLPREVHDAAAGGAPFPRLPDGACAAERDLPHVEGPDVFEIGADGQMRVDGRSVAENLVRGYDLDRDGEVTFTEYLSALD